MRLDYDREADAVYIWMRDAPYAYGEDLDAERRIDYGSDGIPVGVELLNVSAGVRLDDLPDHQTLARLLDRERFNIFA